VKKIMLSIREASRFVIGGEILRREAMKASEGGRTITFDHVAAAALRPGEDGVKLRRSIETLADQESAWLRNTPPHTLKTDRVLQTREAEIRTFVAIHAAVVATIEHAEHASMQDENATRALHDAYQSAYAAIDVSPGSTQDREAYKGALHDQTIAATPYVNEVTSALDLAETAYLEAERDRILSKYDRNSLERSDDYEM
jgi:hypothetical protein